MILPVAVKVYKQGLQRSRAGFEAYSSLTSVSAKSIVSTSSAEGFKLKSLTGAVVLPDTTVFQHNPQIRHQSLFPGERKIA